MDILQGKQYKSLQERFTDCTEDYGPYSYIRIELPFDQADVKKKLAMKKKTGMYCAIPELMFKKSNLPSRFEVYDAYRRFFALCESIGIKSAFNLEVAYERFILGDEGEENEDIASENLTLHSYRCTEEEDIRYNLHKGTLMSLVAYDGNEDIIDLREFVSDGVLTWTVPRGNWDILEFNSLPDTDSGRINYLSYRVSRNYIIEATEELGGIASEMKPESLTAIKYNDIGFIGKNRRMWSRDLNEVFKGEYGFDPSPYYPALFYHIGKDTKRLKAQLMDCRAKMLRDGFCRAAHDYAAEYSISCIGGFIEPKLSACSAVTGDTLLVSMYTPSALLNKAYLYGINSVKIAAGASYCFDRTTVNCDVFKDYRKVDLDIAYKDAMHAFARGANRLIFHSADFEEDNAPSIIKTIMGEENVADFSRFVTCVQSVLKGGRHVSDIALLYPIYSVHSGVYFYDSPVEGFEYPDTPSNLDYMSVINSISFYSGHDLTVLHPNAFNSFCTVKKSKIYLENGNSREKYRVLVIPATSVISITSLEICKEFFDAGGKIIATGELPSYAIESTKDSNRDDEVRALVAHIFGEDAANDNIMRRYAVNRNENGGIAYMLYFTKTAADGTNMVDSKLIEAALNDLSVAYDVSLPEMVKYESTGALNPPYPTFIKMGLSNHLPNGGMINYIHKRRGDIDVYYFSNTTTLKLETPLILRGKLLIDEWNPHTGRMRRLPSTYFVKSYGDAALCFTQVSLELDQAKSTILIGIPEE